MKKVTLYWVFLRANLMGDSIGFVEFKELEAEDRGYFYYIEERLRSPQLDKTQLIKCHVNEQRILLDCYCEWEKFTDTEAALLHRLQEELVKAGKEFDFMFWHGGVVYAQEEYYEIQANKGNVTYYTAGNYSDTVRALIPQGRVVKKEGGIVFKSFFRALDWVRRTNPSYTIYRLLNCKEEDIDSSGGVGRLTKDKIIQEIK